MKRSIKVYIAASLDSYIATEEEGLDWLTGVAGEGDNGYGAFLQTVDTVVMGRRTYEWILAQMGREAFPYLGKTCYVRSGSAPHTDGLATFTNESADALAARLRATEGGDIWLVGGGRMLDDFIRRRLIDAWIVTVAPAILGGGIPLFRAAGVPAALTLTDVRRYGQFAQLTYTAAPADTAATPAPTA